VLVATSEVRIAGAAVRSTLLFERAVRGTVVRRESLAFDGPSHPRDAVDDWRDRDRVRRGLY
jgi:hypothetical protein